MNILFLAPHPFYQDRGTPIAVNLLLQALSQQGHQVDVLTYHEGADVSHPGINIQRIRRPPFASNVPPGPSLKKILCDLVMLPTAFRMAGRKKYDLVHAVEESAYMALVIQRRYGIPYLYDMDSSLARQIAEKFSFLKFLLPLMARLERTVIRGALGVIPVCDALADIARADGARAIFLLRDISLLQPATASDRELVRQLLPDNQRPRLLYLGNLETYQGVDLLLESFASLLKTGGSADLIIAGGKPPDIQYYRERAASLGIAEHTSFLGPQPVSLMAALFEAADILVSPRIKGNNTPMKIYSYLASGKAILATALPTHTQVLTGDVALLAPASTGDFAAAMATLANDADLRAKLGQAAQALAQKSYSRESFLETAREAYTWANNAIQGQS